MNFFVRFRNDDDVGGKDFMVLSAVSEYVDSITMEKPELKMISKGEERTIMDFETGFHALNLYVMEKDLIDEFGMYDVIVSDKEEDR